MSIQPADSPFYGTMTPAEEALLPAEPPAAAPLPTAAPSGVTCPPGGKVLDLPSGYRVALRGTRSVRNRDRARIFEGVDFEANKIEAGLRVMANIERVLITDWDVRDFDDATGLPVGDVLPIPAATSDDVLGLLSMDDAAALDAEAAAVQKVLMPNFEPSPDKASPTQPSGV